MTTSGSYTSIYTCIVLRRAFDKWYGGILLPLHHLFDPRKPHTNVPQLHALHAVAGHPHTVEWIVFKKQYCPLNTTMGIMCTPKKEAVEEKVIQLQVYTRPYIAICCLLTCDQHLAREVFQCRLLLWLCDVMLLNAELQRKLMLKECKTVNCVVLVC